MLVSVPVPSHACMCVCLRLQSRLVFDPVALRVAVRSCTAPFMCRRGYLYDIDSGSAGGLVKRNVNYGCKCPAADNKDVDKNCHTVSQLG